MADLKARLQNALAHRYAIERELGRGGMSVVFLARDLRHEREVAVKVLRPELGVSLGADRFLREIRVSAGLSHPHIVPLHDSGEADGCLYYVMPFVSGESLRARLERDGALSPEEAIRLAREIADALDYAHRQGVVHRDVKPENILLQDGHALVSDFGIARAISAAGGGRLTAVGIAVGTPDYMSPEQAAGNEDVDGRSDLYSLACVLCEMMTGRAPTRGRAPSLDTLPPGVSPDVKEAIGHALAESPDDRFDTAGAFHDALLLPTGAYTPRSLRARRRRRWSIAAGAALAVGALGVTVLPRMLGAGLDRSMYVVVPFGHRGGAAPELLDGDHCELRLYEELSRWSDVKLANEFLLHDAREQLGRAPETLDDAIALARRVGAGLLVWGQVSRFRDSIQVSAMLYDVAGRTPLRQHGVNVATNLADEREKFRELADSLLLGGARAPLAEAGLRGTSYLRASLAYDSGHAALARWDLARAVQAFRAATRADSTYPDANLWLAQVLTWRGASPAEWSGYAGLAAANRSLGPRDRLRADALNALATARYDQACDRYRRLAHLDSTDFTAWFGLGECEAKDRTIVRDPRSRSGWRFRGSYHSAVGAYERAFRINPSAHRAFADRVPELLYMLEPNYIRLGRPIAPDTGLFAAFGSLEGDTLAFIPFPIADVQSGRAGPAIPAALAAVARNRAVIRRIADGWVQRFPASADALETLAWVQETTGDLGAAGDDQRGALAAVRRARRAASVPAQQLRLAVDEARLLLKLEEYGAAIRVADSLLLGAGRATSVEALQLAGLAALTGRTRLTADLLRRAAEVERFIGLRRQPVPLPRGLIEAGQALLAYAALGAPADSVLRLERRVAGLIRDSVRPDRRPEVREALLVVPAVLAFPVVGVQPVHAEVPSPYYLLDLQAALAAGDSAGVRARLAAIAQMRRGAPPGDVAIDGTYQEAWLRLRVGDTAAALAQLDSSLNAQRTLGTSLVTQVPQGSALVRAMALRADLAALAGDRTATKWWAQRVILLWSNADPELQPVVARMRALAGS